MPVPRGRTRPGFSRHRRAPIVVGLELLGQVGVVDTESVRGAPEGVYGSQDPVAALMRGRADDAQQHGRQPVRPRPRDAPHPARRWSAGARTPAACSAHGSSEPPRSACAARDRRRGSPRMSSRTSASTTCPSLPDGPEAGHIAGSSGATRWCSPSTRSPASLASSPAARCRCRTTKRRASRAGSTNARGRSPSPGSSPSPAFSLVDPGTRARHLRLDARRQRRHLPRAAGPHRPPPRPARAHRRLPPTRGLDHRPPPRRVGPAARRDRGDGHRRDPDADRLGDLGGPRLAAPDPRRQPGRIGASTSSWSIVQSRGFLSSRQRRIFEPWRMRPPLVWS